MKRFFLTGSICFLAIVIFGRSNRLNPENLNIKAGFFAAAQIEPVGDQIVDEGEEFSYTFIISDDEDDLQDLSISINGLPSGAFFDESALTLSWTPDETQGGNQYSIELSVVDTDLNLTTENFNITVNETNSEPELLFSETTQSSPELNLINFVVGATDQDIPENQLSFALSGDVPAGASINAATGEFTWTPTEEQGPATYVFDILVTDGHGGTAQQSINITVEEVNTDPIIDPVSNSELLELTTLTINLTSIDSDLPQQGLTYSFSGIDSPSASIDENTGQFTWTPSEAEGPGQYEIFFTVTDIYGGTSTTSSIISVLEDNEDPKIENIENQTINEGEPWTYQVIATDEDIENGVEQVLSYDFKNGFPEGITIDGTTGLISWTPNESQGPGTYEVTVRVRDDGSPRGMDEEKFKIEVLEVNTAPILNDPGSKIVDEQTKLEFTLLSTDTDRPENEIQYSIVSGAASGMNLDSKSGVFSWTPSENQGPSTYVVTFSASDGELSDEVDVEITVNEVNTLPVIGTINDRTINEQTILSFTVNATDSDIPQNTLTYSLKSPPQGASINSSTGQFNWTPDESQGPGNYTITVAVSDGIGESTRSFNVIVNEVNKPPVFTSGAITEAQENVEYVYNVVAEDPDNNDYVTLTVPTIPSWLTFTQTGNGTGTLSGTPGNNDVSDNDVVIRATDNSGATATQSYFITFEIVNDPPEIISSPVTQVQEGAEYLYNIIATDPDPNEQLTFTGLTIPDWLTLTDNGDGRATLTGVPTQANVGSNSVSIRVTDRDGLSDTQSFTVNVQDSPDRPVLKSATLQVNEDDTLRLDSQLFAQYYSDPDNDPLSTVRVITVPSNGSLFLNQMNVVADQIIAADQLDNFYYVPDQDYIGADSIRLRVSDGVETAVNSTWWRINVVGVNDKPEILNFNDFDFFYNGFSELQPIVEFGEIVDGDSETMTFMEAYFTTSYQEEDFLWFDLTGTDLTGAYDPSSGIFRVEGVASKAEYEQVLNTLSYGFSGEAEPRPFPRGIAVVISDGTNLSDVYERIMTFENATIRLDIVDAFTPNSDGINDTWSILNLEFFDTVIIRVFDIEGKQVFYSDGYQEEWDGTSSGEVLPSGTYYFVIDLDRGRMQKGSVTILK
ncbi:putative Ig domain-containing protein [Mangrovivirga sp. M17]|uniref:Ig domain-containing protein n=1 Tax=Mangrovivirga halotolerans TaxID=2993936 RepID=A0ABT3RW51_9BACT|nr:putative Ig domain-containing protein [Mangrovivirga halotolerans]MCX2745876.1 putative Ig domain-containing protein [Mangrovivirga halotolerans]